MQQTSILGNLSLNRLYKFLVYLGSLILILSLFFEVKAFPLNTLRSGAYKTLLTGVILWFADEIFYKVEDYLIAKHDDSEKYRASAFNDFLWLWWAKLLVFVVVLVFGFLGVKLTLGF